MFVPTATSRQSVDGRIGIINLGAPVVVIEKRTNPARICTFDAVETVSRSDGEVRDLSSCHANNGVLEKSEEFVINDLV